MRRQLISIDVAVLLASDVMCQTIAGMSVLGHLGLSRRAAREKYGHGITALCPLRLESQ